MNYLQKRNRLTGVGTENKLMVTKKGGINQEFGINRYTLLYIKIDKHKDLLYSTENYIQYLAVTHNVKESEAVRLKLTQYCNKVQFNF